MMDIEQIIKEGRTLRKSARQIAREVEKQILEKIMWGYIDNEPEFKGRQNIVEFRKFLTDACQSKEKV